MSSFDEKNESQEKNLDKLKRLDDLFSNVGVGRPAKTGLPEDMQEKVKTASAWSMYWRRLRRSSVVELISSIIFPLCVPFQ